MIVRSNPGAEKQLDTTEQAWFESDAESNEQAIREIDAAAGAHGLVRVNEYWLQRHRLPDGRWVRRGFCYRPEETDLVQRLEARRKAEPVGTSSAALLREDREGQ